MGFIPAAILPLAELMLVLGVLGLKYTAALTALKPLDLLQPVQVAFLNDSHLIHNLSLSVFLQLPHTFTGIEPVGEALVTFFAQLYVPLILVQIVPDEQVKEDVPANDRAVSKASGNPMIPRNDLPAPVALVNDRHAITPSTH
jgi:hypothetical protein